METEVTPDTPLAGPSSSSRGWWRPLLLLSVVILALVIARAFDLGSRLGDLESWIRKLGGLGYAVFVVIYAIATVAAIPGTALTAGAGLLFGSVMGVVLVSLASTMGAASAFLIARYFARDSMARSLGRNEKFRKLDRLTERQGAMIVAITRLVPLFPFNLLNYGFGLTRVHFWTYVFWSWICMLPGTILYVVGGDALGKAFREGKIPWPLVGLAAGIFVLLLIVVRVARKRLKDDDKNGDDVDSEGEEKAI